MAKYIPNTSQESLQMLKEIGFNQFSDLYQDVPEEVLLKENLKLDLGKSEQETLRILKQMSNHNVVFEDCFRGAGAYRHFIPSALKLIAAKEEFLTAYTPYQAEISQGILQAIFEFQTYICELTGMDAANASVYDGQTAAAEAVAMCKERKKKQVLVSSCANPQTIETIKTYCFGNEMEVVMMPEKDGGEDFLQLEKLLNQDVACVYVEQPNFYGNILDYTGVADLIHQFKAKWVMGCNPIALAITKTPREWGADIAVGEGQPLGIGLNFGGPYLGYMSCIESMTRKLPGRIVGQTQDSEGKRAFVLTLQAREQHIRREKASSNICSNQAHCALTAGIYLSLMSMQGLEQCATTCHSKALYLKEQLKGLGFKMPHEHEIFHEFVSESSISSTVILKALREKGILGGLPLDESHILWCTTEVNTKESIDCLVDIVKGVGA